MQQVKTWASRVDPGFLIVVVICLIAAWPFLGRPSLPEGTDAELHIFRLHELSYLVRNGEFYPRWAPDFYHGYGYPIFNYYAPLTYYLALPVEWLPGADAVTGVKAIFVAGIFLGGLGVYAFVRDNWGRSGGYVAAAAYAYAPYLQYVDPHIRGALPESFSFGVFPLALWALDRVRQGGSRWAWLAAVAATAALILTHNLMALLFYALLLGWAAWVTGHLVGRWRRNDRQSYLAHVWMALALGLGCAAFFWLPVILERNAVTLNTLIGQGDNYDFRTHFLTVGELLAFSLRPDWSAAQSAFHHNLGVAQWMLGGLGMLALLAGWVRHRFHLAFFAVALFALLFMMLRSSQIVWEAIPFLPFFQFPWRLLGAAAAMLAVLTGAGVEALLRAGVAPRLGQNAVSWVTAALVACPILLGLPVSQPAPWPDFGEVNTLRMSLIENSGRWLGTTSTADYVPKTVEMLPQRKNEVVGHFALGLPPDRVNRATLPDGVSVETEAVRPLLTRYHVSTPKEFRLRLYQFDFPGWQVRLDGQPATTELARPEGFIVVVVPAGEHVVEIEFGTTAARTWAWVVSAASLLLALVVAWRMPEPEGSENTAIQSGGIVRREWPVLVVVLVLTVAYIVLEPLGLFHDDSPAYTAEPAEVDVFANLGDQIALIGYSGPEGAVRAGDELEMTLYWQALRPLEIDYQVFVHVLGADRRPVAQSDRLNPGDFPTRRWSTEEYVIDAHRLALPADLPAGRYSVSAGLWVQSEGWRLPLFDEGGKQVGDNVPLFTLQVE
jgi:hypothetical protein